MSFRYSKGWAPHTATAGIYQEGPDHVRVTFPYHPTVVTQIKELPERKWDPNRKVWVVPRRYLEQVVAILTAHFQQVEHDLDTTQGSQGVPEHYRVLGVLPSAEWPVIEAVHRKLMSIYHPDVGGDPEKAKAINVAYQKIKQERGK